jgi:hypothetical protein
MCQWLKMYRETSEVKYEIEKFLNFEMEVHTEKWDSIENFRIT